MNNKKIIRKYKYDMPRKTIPDGKRKKLKKTILNKKTNS